MGHGSAEKPEESHGGVDPGMAKAQPLAETSTTELLRASEAGEEPALGELLTRHLDDLRAFVRLQTPAHLRGLESESDLVQSACREILQCPDRFTFAGDGQFRNWLYGAALNKVREKTRHWKADRRDPARLCVDEELVSSLARSYGAFQTASAAAISREAVLDIEAAIDRLDAESREVLSLHRFVGLSHAEIAAQRGKTEAAIRMVLHRALASLSGYLG